MASAREFYTGLRDSIESMIQRYRPFRAVVSDTNQGKVQIQPLDADAPLGEYYARLAGPKIEQNDEVAIVDLGGKPFVLGRIQRTSDESVEFGGKVTIPDISASVFSRTYSWASATTASTTNTVTHVPAFLGNITLPEGRWLVSVVGGAMFKNASATGSVSYRMRINDAPSSELVVGNYGDGNWTHAVSGSQWSNISGTFELSLEYHSSGLGNPTYCKNPWVHFIAYRMG